jgi:hypothetical protein
MTWRKIDDDTCDGNEPLSAFLTNGLATNANTYAQELSRSFTLAWPFQSAPKWASYEIPIGFCMIFDVGIGARTIDFVFSCNVGSTRGGSIMVTHQSSQTLVQTPVDPGTTVINLTMTLSSPQDGPQAFFVGWISDIDFDTADTVDIHSAVDSQIAVSRDSFNPRGNGGVFFGVIDCPSTVLVPATPNAGRTRYQVCRITEETGSGHLDGHLHVWPAIEENPPWFDTNFAASKFVTGYLYQLGWIQMFGMCATVTQATGSETSRVYAHDFATSQQGVSRLTGSAYVNLRKQVAAGPAQDQTAGLHAILSRPTPMERYFSVDNDRSVGLNVNFRCYPLSPSVADYTFDVTVETATTVVASDTLANATLPALRPQQRATSTAFEVICANGAAVGPAEWGMSDAMAFSDMLKVAPISLALPSFNAVAGTIYKVSISVLCGVDADAQFHVVGLYIGEH